MLEKSLVKADLIVESLRTVVDLKGERQIKWALEQLDLLYRDGNIGVRNRIVTGISEGSCQVGLPILRRALLTDDSELIRHEAAFGIGEIGEVDDQHLLVTALQKELSLIVRHEAVSALGCIGDETYLPFLEALAQGDDIVAETADYAMNLIRLRQARNEHKKRLPS